jgi:nitronate monooxygenase
VFQTKITELFGVKHPIVSGGMQWVSTAPLVAAVANAGGMGFLTALTHRTPEGLREEIRKTRALTDKPFGVNLTLMPSLRPPDYPAMVRILIEEGIRFVETAGRSPEEFLPTLKEAGVVVVHKCTSVRHSLKAEAIGCDAISADGFECAGHPGEDDVASLVLLPCIVDAVKIPVIASGGFADGRGLVAALALGAEAVNMGTRFLATQEAEVHQNVKQCLIDNDERSTRLILRTLRNTMRVLRNETVDKVLELEAHGAGIAELAPLLSGEMSREEVWDKGNVQSGMFTAGQVIGLIKDIPTVDELLTRIVNQAEAIVRDRLPALAGGPAPA